MGVFIDMKSNNPKHTGFTLIETLIALIVFSFGLLGVAGVMTVSVKSNHNGYMRSQAIFLAASMSDMMRANPLSVKANNYNVNNYNAGYASVFTMCGKSTPCTPANLTSRDLQLWSNLLTQLLPNATGTIICEAHLGLQIHPYSGICTVAISWVESNQASADSTQTISLVVKP